MGNNFFQIMFFSPLKIYTSLLLLMAELFRWHHQTFHVSIHPNTKPYSSWVSPTPPAWCISSSLMYKSSSLMYKIPVVNQGPIIYQWHVFFLENSLLSSFMLNSNKKSWAMISSRRRPVFLRHEDAEHQRLGAQRQQVVFSSWFRCVKNLDLHHRTLWMPMA